MKLTDIQHLCSNLSAPPTPQLLEEVRGYLQELGYDPDNFYQELEMSSRFADTHQDISFSNATIHLHSHSFYEILYCCNTCGAEYLIESRRYRLQRGDIIIVPPGVSHRPLLPEQMYQPYKRDILWLSTEFVDSLSGLFHASTDMHQKSCQLFRTAGSRWEFLGNIFHKGVKENELRAPGWQAAIMGNTITLLVHLKRALMDQSAAPLPAETPELLDQVMEYLETHLAEKITLTDVAKHFFVSETTINLAFRRKMNTSFYRCVTQRRLIAAKTLIAQGVLLENVGEQVGFADYSTFYRSFKKEFGISPKQYKKMLVAESES